MGKFINPFSDWGFKLIFGQEVNKDLLIQFLNDLLEGERHICDIRFLDRDQLPETKDGREIIYDVFCITEMGEEFIVEMQNRYQEHFIDRSLYYASRAITGQGLKGSWNYRLYPVYTVCFMNFHVLDRTPQKFRTDVALMDMQDHTLFSRNLRMIYLMLPLFPKHTEESCETNFERWIYVLNNMQILERMPFMAQNAVFRKLAEITDISTLSREERSKYDESLRILRDNLAAYESAISEGMEKGMKKGLQQGREEGREEGLQQGREEGLQEGREEERMRSACAMKREGISAETISRITGLPLQVVEQL